jgi:hypothetical protein
MLEKKSLQKFKTNFDASPYTGNFSDLNQFSRENWRLSGYLGQNSRSTQAI